MCAYMAWSARAAGLGADVAGVGAVVNWACNKIMHRISLSLVYYPY